MVAKTTADGAMLSCLPKGWKQKCLWLWYDRFREL